ncbi:MAG: tRNA (guanosine(46)-N7)-methyltransferase TrmB [Bacteroidales bacterium]
MSGKDKLKKFKENETFSCLIQPRFVDVYKKDYVYKGKWNEVFFKNDKPIILELGCGKGEYTIDLAKRHPENNYLGVDIKGARLWRGSKTATENHMDNVGFLRTRIDFIDSFFAKSEISEIWITFADPQKNKSKKRLTSILFLDRYKKFLKQNAVINLKTDSKLLYDSTLDVIMNNNLELIENDPDIYHSNRQLDEITEVQTHYESIFLAQGIPITYVKFRFKD